MPTQDVCCFDRRKRCNIDRHFFDRDGYCIEDDPGENCDQPPVSLPRICTDTTVRPFRIRFQCCDSKYIKFANWQSWSKCDGLEDRRINLHACPAQYPSPSNFSFITIFIVLTVLVIVFGLAIVLFKRLRYQRQRRSHGAANTTPGRGRTSASSAAAPRRSSASSTAHGESCSNPTGTGNDLAPPSYEEAILLTDRPPAFDKL